VRAELIAARASLIFPFPNGCQTLACMTVVYWVAAAAAFISSAQAAGELVRDRSPALAGWVLCMVALGASLALAAAVPAVLQGKPGPVAWACAGLSILGTWAFAEVLATTSGDGRRIADMMTIPLLAGAFAVLLLIGLHWAASHDTRDAALAVMGIQLTLVTYYLPGLGRIASLTRQRADAAPACWARVAMRAVFTSAATEIVLIMARSAVLIAGTSGVRTGSAVITVIGFLQGIAAACGIGALAVGPMATLTSAQFRCWLAYRRLRPLWTAVKEAVPDAELPAEADSTVSIRSRLQRRVTEIRTAEQALSPHWRAEVAARALATARSAALSADLEQAFVEATVVLSAADARLRGDPPAPEPLAAEQICGSATDDLDSEITRLVLVSQAVRQNRREHA
jgi:hypothetical protein